MSGDFTQRGEPAFADKWLRAEAAVRCGADLVLELPAFYACGSAEAFAEGAMGILKGLGCISHVSFGSEKGDLDSLQRVAALLAEETPEFKAVLKEGLEGGESFPRARQKAVEHLLGEEAAALLGSPNNILGIEYLKAARRQGFAPEFLTLQRKGAGYHDTDAAAEYASASALRSLLQSEEQGRSETETAFKALDAAALLGDKLPLGTASVYKDAPFFGKEAKKRQFGLVVYKILSSTEEELEQILSAGEGLGNKLKKAVQRSHSLDELMAEMASKRYPDSRIRRLLLQLLLGIDLRKAAQIRYENRLFARVLAFSEEGAKLLKEIRKEKCASIPILTNINKEEEKLQGANTLLALDILASDLYHLLLGQDRYQWSDHRQKPFVLKSKKSD